MNFDELLKGAYTQPDFDTLRPWEFTPSSTLCSRIDTLPFPAKPPIVRGIVQYFKDHGNISERQRNVLIRFAQNRI